MKRLAAALFVLAAAATACSDDGGGERPTEGEEARLATAIEVWTEAFRTNDLATASALLSVRCTAALGVEQFTQIVAAGAEAYPDLAIESWGDVEIDGESATVDYETGEEALDNRPPQVWALEGGEWKYDNC